ncbi:MAG: PadR family transcriptional regulator [Phenylobacterium sp.]|uniref:PadR family transcriptional regulator n=1 Tax=Phenylobacterium sp. TaxID=1871053 RepID=UPI0027333D3B|nr:PadR family transcriptional regulator [Phenylobacterium sp.]MDP3176231.1 PadR family transcriptional regulator [Phenylobacterium sp.]
MHGLFHNHHRRERFGRGPFGGHMGGGHRGGRHGGSRIGRFLEHGDLRFVLLALIAEQPRHGYDLIRELETRTGGAYRPSPGVVYPTLSLLDDEGFIQPSAGDTARKLFEITPAGREALEREGPAVKAVFARMADAAAQSDQTGPRVRRAMENLGSALRIRLSQGAVTEAQVDAIARAIDEAAAAIERV